MHDFKTCGGTKKLMLVASCPRVGAGDCTLFTQATYILELDPEALVVVHHNGKCFFVYRNREGETHWKLMHQSGNPNSTYKRDQKNKRVKTVERALKLLQHRFCHRQRNPNEASSSAAPTTIPVDRRFVVVGYNALNRSTSARTSDMVPTHIFVLMGKNRISADVRQTLMRPAGKSTDVRNNNGHGNVKVVTPERDWEQVTTLYGFQIAVGEEMAQDPQFDFESVEYTIEAEPVVESIRPHTKRGASLKNSWRVVATEEERDDKEEEREEARRERAAKLASLGGVSVTDDESSDEEEDAHEDRDFINDGSDLEEDSDDSGSLVQRPQRLGVDMQSKVLTSMFRFSDGGRNDIRLRDLHGTCPDVAQCVASQHNIYERLRNKGFIRHISSGVYALTKSGVDYCSSIRSA